jgi:hypothetical protein
VRRPAALDAFVLAGEEIPTCFSGSRSEHPASDDYVRAISRYHRLEEARHLAFARTTIGEHYRHTTWTDRFAVRWIVPIAIVAMFDIIVQPFVYPTVGLPAVRTWLRVRRQPQRVGLRQQCARAVLTALIDARVFTSERIPLPWRRVANDASGGANTSRTIIVNALVMLLSVVPTDAPLSAMSTRFSTETSWAS